MHLDVEAVFAGDAVALGDLRDLGGELGDARQLAGAGFTRTIASSW